MYLNEKYGYKFREVKNHHELEAILKFTFGVDLINDQIANPMTGEAYFKLLEYEELSLARKNAREARWLSIGAIAIAIIAVFVEFFK